jgi:hypothetical protein
MRFTVVFLCLVMSGCSTIGGWFGRGNDSAEEDAEVVSTPRKQEPREKPSDVLKAPRKELASPVSDYFYVRAGVYGASAETQFRLDETVNGVTTVGTLLSAERDLGLKDDPIQGKLEFSIRLKERSRVRVDFLQVDRDNIQQINRDIVFGGEQFLLNDRVQSLFDLRVISATYTYSPLKFDRFELGTGIGIHGIVAEARGRVQARNQSVIESGAVPFATVALDAAFRISKRWAVTARGQYFSAKIADVDGSFGDYHADIQYRLRKNFAFGLGYSSTQIDLISESNDFPGLFNLDVSGPELFFRVSF